MGNRAGRAGALEGDEGEWLQTYSVSSAPGMSTIAFWVAQQVLAGKKVPNTVNVPLLAIQDDTLDAWLAATPVGTAASPRYTKEDTVALIDATVAGKKRQRPAAGEVPQ